MPIPLDVETAIVARWQGDLECTSLFNLILGRCYAFNNKNIVPLGKAETFLIYLLQLDQRHKATKLTTIILGTMVIFVALTLWVLFDWRLFYREIRYGIRQRITNTGGHITLEDCEQRLTIAQTTFAARLEELRAIANRDPYFVIHPEGGNDINAYGGDEPHRAEEMAEMLEKMFTLGDGDRNEVDEKDDMM